jgi:hypothetical protein
MSIPFSRIASGRNAIELLAPDGAEPLPPISRLEVGLRAELASGDREASRDESVTNGR